MTFSEKLINSASHCECMNLSGAVANALSSLILANHLLLAKSVAKDMGPGCDV